MSNADGDLKFHKILKDVLNLSYALRNLGLLNHPVWVETTTLKLVPFSYEDSTPRDLLAPDWMDISKNY